MPVIHSNGEEIYINIIFSKKRRTWSLSVNPKGEVTMRVPAHVSEERALEIAKEKADWILKQKNKFLTRGEVIRRYNTGDTIPFFGEELKIVRETGPASAKIADGVLHISIPEGFEAKDAEDTARETVILLYRRLGPKVLDEFVSQYSQKAGVEKPALRIALRNGRWGSCTPKNGIIINAKILLAPKIVAEYLVVHEIAHIRFRHHQKSFKDEVERLMPAYAEAEKLIREDGWKWFF